MIKTFFSISVILILCAQTKSYGQVYEKIYSESNQEIQSKIDLNKQSGIDILTGIFSEHVVGLTNFSVSKIESIKKLLSENNEILTFYVSDDFTSLKISATAKFTKENLQEILKNSGIVLTGYTISYHL